MDKKINNVKILVVSESDQLLITIKNMLSQNKLYHVDVVAISLCNFHETGVCTDYDVFIINCSTKAPDTIHLLKKIKNKYPFLRILIISGDNTLVNMKSVCSMGVDGYLIKDDINKLEEAVDNICRGKRYINEMLSNCLLQNMILQSFELFLNELIAAPAPASAWQCSWDPSEISEHHRLLAWTIVQGPFKQVQKQYLERIRCFRSLFNFPEPHGLECTNPGTLYK